MDRSMLCRRGLVNLISHEQFGSYRDNSVCEATLPTLVHRELDSLRGVLMPIDFNFFTPVVLNFSSWNRIFLLAFSLGISRLIFPSIYFLFVFSLEYNCFTMLCQFLLYNSVNQLNVKIYLLPLEPPCHFPPLPPLQVITEHHLELPVLHSSFPLGICFTCDSVCVSMLLSRFVLPSPLDISCKL